MEEPFDTGLTPAEIDPERPRPLQTPWGAFALFRVGERVLCVQSFCPHLGGPLFQGTLSGLTITCPWHAWTFSLESGARVDLVGRLVGRGVALARCRVEIAPHGRILLHPPAGPDARG